MDRATAIKTAVVGFLVPEFRDEATGMAALWPADFEKVRQGFACASCLAVFEHYTVKCPVCGLERDVAADIRETPAPWADHLAERDKPTHRTRVASAEDALQHLATSPDVERVPLKGLRPSKWGRQ